MRLTLHKEQKTVCKGGNPTGKPVGKYYYTAFPVICKVSIMTKIGKKICGKAYELEFYAHLNALFCGFFQWTFMSYIFAPLLFGKKWIDFEKEALEKSKFPLQIPIFVIQ